MKKLLKIMTAVLLCCLLFSGCSVRPKKQNSGLRITASFYPIYIMALNITDGADVTLSNVAGQQAGCLHDYQLTNDNMKEIEDSDVFIINGAGMESFVEEVAREAPKLTVIDASENAELIVENGEENSHLWVSISGCILEVQNISQKLCEADPENAALYRKNTEEYVAKLKTLQDKMHAELDALPNRDIITLHEAFPYFAREFNLRIVGVLNREPDSSPSAKELAQTIDLVEELGVKVLFAEPQYSGSAAEIVAAETGATVYFLDPAVTGENDKNAYLDAMEKNLTVLKEALR